MTITATLYQSNVELGRAWGAHLDTAGGAKTITVGFKPRRVKWFDETNLHSWEWFDGMANGTTLKTHGSTQARTLDTTDVGISVAQDTAQGALTATAYMPALAKGSYVVSIAAAIAAASAQCRFEVMG